jgi:hypothetical protein
MLTENTVVIKPEAEERIMADLEEYPSCRGINKVFQNDKMIIILFDNNGDNPWDIEGTRNTHADWEDILFIETNYGNGEYWSQVFDEKESYVVDTSMKFINWIRDKVNGVEYYTIKDVTRYNI